jgi:hypothetical protein
MMKVMVRGYLKVIPKVTRRELKQLTIKPLKRVELMKLV